MMQVFLDCDGVLADFDGFAAEILGMPPRDYEREKHNNSDLWERLYAVEDYFFKLPKMHDADELVAGVEAFGFAPIILTGIPSKGGSDWAIDQKTRWAQVHFPNLDIICCKSKEKAFNMIEGKHNVLIDDWTQYKHVWEEHGGSFIVHTSAKKSLAELQQLDMLMNIQGVY
jgi:hypothetical protein